MAAESKGPHEMTELEEIVAWLEQQPDSTRCLVDINRGAPAAEVLAEYLFDHRDDLR